MKKILLAILILSLVPLMACSESAPAAQSGMVSQVTAMWEASPTWNSYGPRITALEARPQSQASTFDSSNLNNKDNDLQNQINTMKTDMQGKIDALTKQVNELSPGSGSGSTPTSDTGTVVFTNNPVSIPQIFSSSSGGNSNPWIMTIRNNSSTWQYVKPMVSLNVASGQPSSIVTDVSLMTSGGSCSLTGTLSIPGNFTFSPSNMATVATPSVIIFPISGCNGSGEWYIGSGQSQSSNIQIQGLKTTNPILWNVSASISSRSM